VIYKQGFNDKVFELLESFLWNQSSKLGWLGYNCIAKPKMQAWKPGGAIVGGKEVIA
jgi:hypothetical protein